MALGLFRTARREVKMIDGFCESSRKVRKEIRKGSELAEANPWKEANSAKTLTALISHNVPTPISSTFSTASMTGTTAEDDCRTKACIAAFFSEQCCTHTSMLTEHSSWPISSRKGSSEPLCARVRTESVDLVRGNCVFLGVCFPFHTCLPT